MGYCYNTTQIPSLFLPPTHVARHPFLYLSHQLFRLFLQPSPYLLSHQQAKCTANASFNPPRLNGLAKKSSAPASLNLALDSVFTTAVNATMMCLRCNLPEDSKARISAVAVMPSFLGMDWSYCKYVSMTRRKKEGGSVTYHEDDVDGVIMEEGL